MSTGNGKFVPCLRRERMRALVEAARHLHPYFTLPMLAKTLAAPVRTVRAVLYEDYIVSHETIDRWSAAIEEGIPRDEAIAAVRHANVRRALRKVKGMANDAATSLGGSDPNETGGADI